MLKITVCIGSSCHIKGSRQVVEQLQYLISENNLGDKVELGGTFCMGKCQQGVCVTVNDSFHSVTPESEESSSQKKFWQRYKKYVVRSGLCWLVLPSQGLAGYCRAF